MLSFEEAALILDEAAEALPREIFEKLNGGVNLLPFSKHDANGLLVMGMYIVDQMGRRVEIYYGSFEEAHREASLEKLRRELIHTLKHELTHHIEHLAGDRSLEKWDDRHVAELLAGLSDEPLSADSLLFIGADGLGEIACAIFKKAAAEAELDMRCAAARLPDSEPGAKALMVAEAFGLRTERAAPLSEFLLTEFDAILCMTERQAEAIAERFPEFDEKIMCLGAKDIVAPMIGARLLWQGTIEKLWREIDYLIEELSGEAEDDDENS